MSTNAVLILDCGATNVRSIAVGPDGQILASHHIKNETSPAKEHPDYHVWDFELIWKKLSECAREVVNSLTSVNISAIAVTTFGVDGAPFDKQGNQIYPIISWKCPRTVPVMENLDKVFDSKELYRKNGIGNYSFNTLFKLLWLKENQPEIYGKMDKFVFISSMINQRLTGVLSTDLTMAGTSMMTNLETQTWHQPILDILGLTPNHFPPMVSAGQEVGKLTPEIAKSLNLPAGIPVISAGHDTQFALFGSGAQPNQPVLSSGTWEILMARVPQPILDEKHRSLGLTTEFDSRQNLFNPGVQWLSSAVLEWLTGLLFSDILSQKNKYDLMENSASEEQPGCGGVSLKSPFSANAQGIGTGNIQGLSIHTRRGQIYRAALEMLALQLKNSLKTLEEASAFKATKLIVVGGGSKNAIWNQIRADILNLPIHVVSQSETTVLGAAMFAFAGTGFYSSPEAAQEAMRPTHKVILPGENAAIYSQLFS